jgi:G:T-mismatch repair DNA endonuclease (very short patch repair protein)
VLIRQPSPVPVQPARPESLRGRVFRGTSAVRRGLVTEDQLRSGAWRRLRRDVYADAALPVTHLLHARGVGLVAPRQAVFGGLTAVMLWGGQDFATADDPVEVLLPPGVRWAPSWGVTVRTASLGVADTARRAGWLPRTSRARTAVDLIRRGRVDDGVVLLDRLVHAGVVPFFDVCDAVGELPRCRGSRLAREIAGLADGLAESPPETRLRLLMLRAGLPRPVAQFRVFDDEGLIGRLDFAFPERKIAIEYDGAWHGERGQLARDRKRLNRLAAAGWRVVFVTAEDMRNPEALVRQLAAVLRS